MPIAHAAILLSPASAGLRLALVIGLDAGLIVFFAIRSRRRAQAAAEAPPLPSLPAEIVPTAVPLPADVSEAVELEAADAEAVSERFAAIGRLARECLASSEALLDEASRIGGARTAVTELYADLSVAKEGSSLLRENTDRIFDISSNLADSTEQAFNLSRDVESKATAMAGELAASLAETESLLVESKRISDVLTIMADIASTTNILSFNASIVAANAGAHGKPFGVVAKEMRKLSESTEASLRDITSIVRTIQEKVRQVSDRIRAVNEGVKDEKEAMVAVAGGLQGVMLANEVIRTVSSLCVQKSGEGLESFRSLTGKAAAAMGALEARLPPERIELLATGLKKVVEIAGEEKP